VRKVSNHQYIFPVRISHSQNHQEAARWFCSSSLSLALIQSYPLTSMEKTRSRSRSHSAAGSCSDIDVSRLVPRMSKWSLVLDRHAAPNCAPVVSEMHPVSLVDEYSSGIPEPRSIRVLDWPPTVVSTRSTAQLTSTRPVLLSPPSQYICSLSGGSTRSSRVHSFNMSTSLLSSF
jgi:hypothetical protein